MIFADKHMQSFKGQNNGVQKSLLNGPNARNKTAHALLIGSKEPLYELHSDHILRNQKRNATEKSQRINRHSGTAPRMKTANFSNHSNSFLEDHSLNSRDKKMTRLPKML